MVDIASKKGKYGYEFILCHNKKRGYYIAIRGTNWHGTKTKTMFTLDQERVEIINELWNKIEV